MKKKFKVLFILTLLMFLPGCTLFKDDLENAKIYTTVYPISYIMKYLYSSYSSNIESIYPSDADINNYKLTDKKIKEYSKADLFVYIGQTNEKTYAQQLVNKNNDLLIIDATYNITLENNEIELWLSPNNYLTLAKNIKDNLEEYLNNTSLISYVDSKYNEFEENISIMDASLHTVGKTAKSNNKNVLVVSNSGLKFLKNYGFEIICLDDEMSENKLNSIKNNFANAKYKNIITVDTDINNELIQELKNNYSANIVTVNSLTLSQDIDYFSEMNEFIEKLKNLVS